MFCSIVCASAFKIWKHNGRRNSLSIGFVLAVKLPYFGGSADTRFALNERSSLAV